VIAFILPPAATALQTFNPRHATTLCGDPQMSLDHCRDQRTLRRTLPQRLGSLGDRGATLNDDFCFTVFHMLLKKLRSRSIREPINRGVAKVAFAFVHKLGGPAGHDKLSAIAPTTSLENFMQTTESSLRALAVLLSGLPSVLGFILGFLMSPLANGSIGQGFPCRSAHRLIS
jgi:hypothetical protein